MDANTRDQASRRPNGARETQIPAPLQQADGALTPGEAGCAARRVRSVLDGRPDREAVPARFAGCLPLLLRAVGTW
ncbi:hypothetical protein [Streptomyces sp. NRRL B-24572]|uniref:hypothetical protein n=1 Tax=Streptomyces sp. NRRL B-24572 TaxID=1962156 RepID=UPI000A3C75A1|nr:hypothetical protein [Streptomyces sp. NRRL B-24572]